MAAREDRPVGGGTGFFGQSLRSMSIERRRQMIDPEHPELSIVRQCELASISRSGFYYQPAGETPLNLELMRLIDRQFLETPWYGSRQEAYPVDSGNATCSVSHSGDHGIAETNSRWREGTRFPSFKMRFPTRRIVWRSCSSAVGPAVSSAPPAARLAVLH